MRRWELEGVEYCNARLRDTVGDSYGRRKGSFSTEADVTDYALDADVEALLNFEAAGVQIGMYDLTEGQEVIHVGAGSWQGPTGILVLGRDSTLRRWVVRVQPGPTTVTTYDFWYRPRLVQMGAPDDPLPLPSIFHPAVKAYCFAELATRQEDFAFLETQRNAQEAKLATACARYKPALGVREGFRSAYVDGAGAARSLGRRP